jgi:predicted nucleotidyltransferase
MYANDFNMVQSDANGQFVKISEINKMIKYGVISVDREKLKEYKFDTTVIYNKEKMTREEAMKLWYGNQ